MTRGGLLVVLGDGGHTTEMLNLVDQLDPRHRIRYVVAIEDETSLVRIRRQGPVHRIHRPRGKSSGAINALARTLASGFQAVRLVARVRPEALISTGPALGVPLAVAAKVFGAQVIFIETLARVTTVSLTGRLMRHLADVYFVQWPALQERLPESHYAGRLL